MGGGSRWREEQAEVLDFAEKLHYDHSPGGSLIPETDDKGAWVDWRDDFGRWKDKNVALEDSGQAWWQTYTAPSEGGSGGGGGGLLTNPGTGIGPYPADNMYFPQLVPEYEAPQAQDWSQYMPSGGPLSQMGGLLYQPGTQEYMEQFPMPENIWNYQPPQINRQPVQYTNPLFGPMNVIMPGGEGEDEDEEEYDPNKDPGWDEPYGSADPMDIHDVRGSTNMGDWSLAQMAAQEAQEADEASKGYIGNQGGWAPEAGE
jgi:hypothetical protein